MRGAGHSERGGRLGDVETVFREALRLDARDREPFVRRRCGSDDELRDEVLSLLAEDARTSGALDRAAFGVSVSVAAIAGGASLSPVPETVGRYRIVRRLGRGGMGLVYEAEQEGLRRRVALKVIEADSATPESLRRFRHEAELLARLQHPGIAQVFESGEFEDGGQLRPYLVMELIDGVPITTFGQSLDRKGRIELLARVCDAVQHAHQRGVIHRDLKPSNILTESGGQPRILDFGVARAVDEPTLAASLRTGVGQLVGTLAYMSPEQAAGAASEIDARSDIYALGVIGYELLAGRLPHDPRGQPVHEAARTIIESEPPAPRSVDRSLAGDIDVILRKALAKQPADRYQSASELGSDLRRHLRDEPILARSPGTWHHVRSFARRHRGLVALGSGAVVVLTLALGAMAWGYVTAVSARNRQKELADDAARESAISTQIAEFAGAMIGAIEPNVAGDSDTTLLRRVLDDSAVRIERDADLVPEVEASIRTMVGNAYLAIGETDLASPHLERAWELREEVLGPRHLDTIQSLDRLATVRRDEGHLDDAEATYRTALGRFPESTPESDPLRLTIRNNLAYLLRLRGSLDEASSILEGVIAARRVSLGDVHPDTLTSIHNLGAVRRGQGRFGDAEALFREAYEGRSRALGEDSLLAMYSAANLAITLQNLGRLDESESLTRTSLERCRAVLGSDHPSTLKAEMNLAILLTSRGRYDEAAEMLRGVADGIVATRGRDHPEALLPLANLGAIERMRGRPEEALRILDDVVPRAERVYGKGHEKTVQASTERTITLLALRRHDEALPAAEATLADSRAGLGELHPETLRAAHTVGVALMKLERFEEAEANLRATHDGRLHVFGPDHAATASARNALAKCLRSLGRDLEADEMMQEETEARAVQPSGEPDGSPAPR